MMTPRSHDLSEVAAALSPAKACIFVQAMSYFTDLAANPGGCWTCTHWHGETTDQGRRFLTTKNSAHRSVMKYCADSIRRASWHL